MFGFESLIRRRSSSIYRGGAGEAAVAMRAIGC
jgi:hypothetical protein